MEWTEDKLRTKIPAKIREDLRADGRNPDIRPTYDWLRDNGYSGIEGYARRNDMTVAEVLEDICGFDPRPGKPLGIDHAETRRLIKEWLEREETLFNQWNHGRIQDARTHFRTLAEVAAEELGSTNLLRLAREDSPADVNLIMQLFAGLASRLESQGAQSNYTRSLERWADYLALLEEVDDHKIDEVRQMMGYTYERKSPEHNLTVKQIRTCWRATETLEEQMVLLILTVSGIRRREPTDTKVDYLRLDRPDPYIVFDESRKTGAATVPIMAGVEIFEAWLDHLEELDHWDGEWLFPSKKSEDGSRPPGWINDVIEEIVTRAGVTFPDGEVPTPKSFRAFWYEHYNSARQEWLVQLERLADDQGVESSEIIDMHYLTNKGERDHFRKFAQSYFSAVFGREMVHGFDAIQEEREAERDEIIQKAIDDYMEEVREELADDSPESDDDEESVHESPATVDPVSAWAEARLKAEHAAVAASDTVDGYPPSLGRAAAIGVGLAGWAAVIGTIWGLSGAFYIAPATGDVTVSAGTVVGLLLGVLLVIADLPDYPTTDTRQPIE